MKMIAAVWALACASTFAQAAFDAASVKPTAASAGAAGRIQVSGGRATFTNRTLFQLLTYAYGIGCCDRIKGPSWISSDRFDIAAKAPDGTPADSIPSMTQALLIERFKLALHRENRELPVYNLVRGRGKLTLQSADSAALKNDWAISGEHRNAKSMNMESLSTYLTMTLRTPVFDKTGFDGYYDFSFDPSKEETLNASAPSIFDIIAGLGLGLESKKALLDVLVIDSANRTPSGN